MVTLEHNGKRLHYLAMPRTASKATVHALMELGGVRTSGHHSLPKAGQVKPGELVITTVRNHYDWFASFYRCFGRVDTKPYAKPIAEFIDLFCEKCPNFVHPGRGLFDHYGDHATDRLRFENLEDGLAKFLGSRGFPVPVLPRLERDPIRRTHYREIITPAARRYIEDRFSEEMEWLGYGWD